MHAINTALGLCMLTDQIPLRIESWDPTKHHHSDFDCGVDRLNNYLKLTAKKQQKSNMTRVYIATRASDPAVLGYYAINMGAVNASVLPKPPKSAPAHGELPALFLGQVAVHQEAQGFGVGRILMYHLFEKTRLLADQAGCFALLLDVMSDGSDADFQKRKQWYESFGFQSLPSRLSRMFLTMSQIRSLTD